jgi:hypothetical protein
MSASAEILNEEFFEPTGPHGNRDCEANRGAAKPDRRQQERPGMIPKTDGRRQKRNRADPQSRKYWPARRGKGIGQSRRFPISPSSALLRPVICGCV